MHTKFISAKLDRVSSGLLVIFALDSAAEKKQTKPVIKLLTAGRSVSQGDCGDPEQR